MAGSYERRINLYINGDVVRNDVKSITAEMTKLRNEQARMIIGSQEYVAKAKEIRTLKGILAEHQQQIAAVSNSWSFKSMADGANRYFAVITAGIATFTGLMFGIKQIVKSFDDFEERVSNLSALTGLSGKDLTYLSDKAKELSTSVLEGGIRVKLSAQDIVDGFEKMGSARPELLQHKEDLVEVTKQALILAAASKMEMGPAIQAVAAAMNQFNLGASQSNRIINVLGAGALAGSSEIEDLTMSLKNVGTVAANSNLSIEQTVGVLETLAERQLKGEEAGTQLKTSLISLKAAGMGYTSGVFNMRDAIVELNAKMASKSTAMEKDNVLIGVFGKRNITVGTILSTSIDRFDYFTKAVTGTNVAMEQAAVNSDNAAAKLAQARNKINVLSIELGEKLSPALLVSTNGVYYMIKGLTVIIGWFNQYKGVIVTTIATLLAYTTAVQIQTIWQNRNNAESLINIALSKAKRLAMLAEMAAYSLFSAVTALLEGNITKAKIAFMKFNAVMKTNPIGLIVGLLVAVGTALYFYTKQLTDVELAQKAVNDINLEAQKNIVDEKIKLGTLLDIARNEKLSKEQRLSAIKQLNAISPEYLGNLTLESINTDTAKKSVNEYIDSLLVKARVQASEQKLAEIEKQRLDDLASGADKQTSIWQKIGESMASGGDAMLYKRLMEVKATENATKANEAYLAKIKAVKDVISEGTPSVLTPATTESGGGENKATIDLIALQEKELENAKKMPGATEAEIEARNKKIESIQREITRLNQLGTIKEGDGDAETIKKNVKAIEAANDAKVAAINKRHLEENTSEGEFNGELLKQELKFLHDKASAYTVGSKEYEAAQMLSLEKQVAAEKKVKDLIVQAQKELANGNISSMEDGIAKEKALEEQRWKDEKDALQKRLDAIAENSAQEVELKKTVNELILAKEKDHLKKMDDLTKTDELQKQMDAAVIADLTANTLKEKTDAERKIAKANYDLEVKAAKGNAAKMATAEKNLSDKLIAIKQNELDKRKEIGDAIFSAGNELFGALVQLAGKESALGKAMFLLQQATAIGQIIFNTAIANAKAVAASPLTLGQPWVTINTITAGISIASVIAQTIAGFSEGGYTGDGDKNDAAGVVHKGEYVIPKEGVNNRKLQPLFNMLESARRNNSLNTLDLRPEVLSGISGKPPTGFETTAGASTPVVVQMADPETKAALQESARTNKALMEELQKMQKNGIEAFTVLTGKNKFYDRDAQYKSLKAKTTL